MRLTRSRPGVCRGDGGYPFEVQQGNQFFDALGLTQVRRQDLRSALLSLWLLAAIVDARLLDFQLPEAVGDLARIADDRHEMLIEPLVDFEKARAQAIRDTEPTSPF